MKKITVKIPPQPAASYIIWIHSGLLQEPRRWLGKNVCADHIAVITDSNVKKLYGDALVHHLKKEGYPAFLLSFRAGEKSKNDHTKQRLEEQLAKKGCSRNTLCLALGGGVVGDIAGFVAATYMRGIPFIQIPTSLLAMVDSSVGGKTAIDTAYGKNMIGAFWQPLAVVSDISCLRSLSKKHRINGLIEAIKIFLTNDSRSFFYTKKKIDSCLENDEKTLKTVITSAVKIKAGIIQKDEKEFGMRMICNFGHTIGHALEKVSDYSMLHGYAVAYGILFESKISQLLGILDEKDYRIIQSLFEKFDIFGKDLRKYDIKKIIKATKRDKKSKAGKTRYILLKKIGRIYRTKDNYAHPVPDEIIKKAYQEI